MPKIFYWKPESLDKDTRLFDIYKKTFHEIVSQYLDRATQETVAKQELVGILEELIYKLEN